MHLNQRQAPTEETHVPVLNFILACFLFPGNLALEKCGISIEEDGGLFRSFINMCVWGAVALGLALQVFA
jgi:hypothetical protein